MDKLIRRLVEHQTPATPTQVTQLVRHAAAAPFAGDLLEIDAPLWGSFWHFDVISPGYRLPAVELALLRAIRLDHHWPEETRVEHFLADLGQAILHPQAGIWTLVRAEAPCLVFVAPTGPLSSTVVWYCATTGCLHAGYRSDPSSWLEFEGGVVHKKFGLTSFPQPSTQTRLDWIEQTLEHKEEPNSGSFAEQLDYEILRARVRLTS